MTDSSALPIDEILPQLLNALRCEGRAVLQAPPGAGKTTRVPLCLLEAELFSGRILMLEPRRLAARSAAQHMADLLGEEVGQRIGYRIRGEVKSSKHTRVEVITEGILTRMLQSNPELPGISCVIFDEFHERALPSDLGLALCLEVREALRDDLALIVMSATLDAEPVAELMGNAPILTSKGRSYPVDIIWRERPAPSGRNWTNGMADLIEMALDQSKGGALAFLPGEGEIRKVAQLLAPKLTPEIDLHMLFGAMPFAKQRAALTPAIGRRKLVLATAIAETSLTIPDIELVIDGGLARRARFDPNSGMGRLVTERVSKAEATQRQGRAGRIAPGRCYRNWMRGQEGALVTFAPPEILCADLASLALELAEWGSRPQDMEFLTPPSPALYEQAQATLSMLGAIDATGRISTHGKEIAAMPLHPRLAHMLCIAGAKAAPLAALLSQRDPLRIGLDKSDLTPRLQALRNPKAFAADTGINPDFELCAQINREAKELAKRAPSRENQFSAAQMAALAYPDRIALRRKGDAPRYLLSGGKGGFLPADDTLANIRLLVVTDLDGDQREAKIRRALPLSETELREIFADGIAWVKICEWSKPDGKVLARQQERFKSLVLQDRHWRDVPKEALARAMIEGVRELGLHFSPAAERLRARVALMPAPFPSMAIADLIENLSNWLLPYLTDMRSKEERRSFDLLPALEAMLDWQERQALDAAIPSSFQTPLGNKIAIDYRGEAPEIAVRLQEMFGQNQHPHVGGKALRVTLLSPAGRPLQTTQDLPGFWQSSYADVRKDMRGRYPKHSWPEDPSQALPTRSAKKRKPERKD